MSDDFALPLNVQDAALRMTDILRAENVALAAMDFVRAGALLAQKQICADQLAAAFRATAPDIGADPAALQELAMLAADNKRLLNRAMRVQRRVLELVARAAKASQPANLYGRAGTPRARRIPAATLVNNA
jgi:hypothetical protein